MTEHTRKAMEISLMTISICVVMGLLSLRFPIFLTLANMSKNVFDVGKNYLSFMFCVKKIFSTFLTSVNNLGEIIRKKSAQRFR